MTAVTYDRLEMAEMVAKFEGYPGTIDMYDNALCYRLQIKYRIVLRYTAPLPDGHILYYSGWSDYCKTPNEAIFLAIIDNNILPRQRI